MSLVRLNKLLAERGVGARRKCDALIRAGEVRVDGVVTTEPGTRVDPAVQRVTWRGKALPKAPGLVYYMLNKPGGVITTLHDPEGRRSVDQLLPRGPRLFPVGRLDTGTTGLLLVTNDGPLAHRLMHPRYGVVKVYRLSLAEPPRPDQVRRLEEGAPLPGGRSAAPARVRLRGRRGQHYVVDLLMHEGRYHLVRDLCETLGLRLLHLHRVAYGPLRLGELRPGKWRALTVEEIRWLRAGARRPRDVPPRGGGALRGRRPASEEAAAGGWARQAARPAGRSGRLHGRARRRGGRRS
jgi:pseudouridine synthase